MTEGHSQLDDFLLKLTSELREGLRHGFFRFSVTSEIGHGGKRHVVLEAGKEYKFTIPKEELGK